MSRLPIPKGPHAGGCLCGAARYRIEAFPLGVNACHCTDCKRSSGATHGVFIHTTREAVILEEGDVARYRKIADSGRAIDIVRCATCGTRLWHEPLSAAELAFVASGTLDDSSWATPASHIWTSRAAADFPFEADALVYPHAPDDRQKLWDRFTELYR
jgi:hypothetical protein